MMKFKYCYPWNSTGIYLTNGVAFDNDGNQLMIRERGKLTWAVKAIRAT